MLVKNKFITIYIVIHIPITNDINFKSRLNKNQLLINGSTALPRKFYVLSYKIFYSVVCLVFRSFICKAVKFNRLLHELCPHYKAINCQQWPTVIFLHTATTRRPQVLLSLLWCLLRELIACRLLRTRQRRRQPPMFLARKLFW